MRFKYLMKVVGIIFAFSLFIFSCKKENNNSIGTQLKLSKYKIEATIDSGRETIDVSSNGNWSVEITKGEDWLELKDYKDKSGNGSFSFYYKSNEDGVPRVGSIVIYGGVVSDTIRVSQGGEDVMLEMSQNEYLDEYGKGGKDSLKIRTNIPNNKIVIKKEYNESGDDWIRDVKLEKDTLFFNIQPNSSDVDVREAVIKLLYSDPSSKKYSIEIKFKQNPLLANSWFVKVDGDGNGDSWDDAMSGSEFIDKINDFENGDKIYFAGGTYKVDVSGGPLEIDAGIEVIGGFDPNSTGQNTVIDYPSQFETILSGDLNGNGVPDQGDTRLINIITKEKISFKGITFKHSYGDNVAFSTSTGSDVDFIYCTFEDNKSTGNGGALFVYNGSEVYCYKTVFKNNKAHQRGAAIYVMGGTVVLEASLVTDNELDDRFGGAIQLSGGKGDGKVYLINSSIVNNRSDKYGSGISVSSGQYLYSVSSTIANNECVTQNDNEVQGQNLRVESDRVYLINTVVTSGTNVGEDIYTNSGSTVHSYGGNIIGAVSGNYDDYSTDVMNKKSTEVFGTNILSDNGGYPQTIALKTDLVTTPVSELDNFVSSEVNLTRDIDVSVDQRGEKRSSNAASSGAYEKQ